ncbi:ABC transporter ATP-binding protein [Pseudochelatococcus lubricantis]|uniref:ABC transporter ATP-binding protein n=1 Tax=Pseudochelatococcus lubricantis TaxID=1538102 RepID=UPI0035EBE99A
MDASERPFLDLTGVTVSYGSTRVLEGIDLGIGKGEFVALLGASGCGKTTLLRTIAGFIVPDAGTVSVGGHDVTRLPPDRRGMALMFQSYALWPHMTVAQNIGYGLKLRRQSRADIARRVGEIAAMLGLQGLEARKPASLSGGQRQRVALGRSLAVDPEILLLDEPLSNLDARIRLSLRHEIRTLQQRMGITAVHVTHDREEAMVMADSIVILDKGRIAQRGTPEEVYNRPASAFVAAFMGAENVLTLSGSASGEGFAIAPGPFNAGCLVPGPLPTGGVEVRFRAEAGTLGPADAPPPEDGRTLRLAGHVVSTSYPGGIWRHAVRLGEGAADGATVLVDAPHPVAQGQAVSVLLPPDTFFVFPAAGEAPPPASDSRSGDRRRRLEVQQA